MKLTESKKLAEHIMRLLKVRQVSFSLAQTEKGQLSMKYTKYVEAYELVLDAVPLATADFLKDDNNRELQGLVEKYLFEPEVE